MRRLAPSELSADVEATPDSAVLKTAAPLPHVGVLISTEHGYGRGYVRGVTRYATTQARWRLVLETAPTADKAKDLAWVDAMIVLPVGDAFAEVVRSLLIPIVNVSARLRGEGLPTVCADERAIGEAAGHHLVSRGYERFAAVGNTRDASYRRRRDGFAAAVAAAGGEVQDLDVTGLFGGGPGWEAMRDRLAALPKPIALFAYDDIAARLLVQCAAEADVRIPEEVAVVGVNNDTLLCEATTPPISSVDCRFEEVGFLAGQLLDRLMLGENPPSQALLVQPGDVVERRSSDHFAVEDRRLALALAYMHEHACDPCHVVDVVRNLRIGRRWLERMFARRLRLTPHQHLNQLRLDHARRLLRDTRLGVADIAERSGFGFEPNLRRAFTTRYRQTPARFRRDVTAA